MLFDEATHRIIGCGIVGPNAGDLIAEAALAIEMGADAADIGLTIHPHPTLSETIGMAAEDVRGNDHRPDRTEEEVNREKNAGPLDDTRQDLGHPGHDRETVSDEGRKVDPYNTKLRWDTTLVVMARRVRATCSSTCRDRWPRTRRAMTRGRPRSVKLIAGWYQIRETAMSVKPVSAAVVHKRKWYHHLYMQVLTAIVIGGLLGYFYPRYGAAMKPLGDAFIKLIRMLIAPIIFCTVVHGVASMET